MNAQSSGSEQYSDQIARNIYSQVYATADGETNGAIIISSNTAYNNDDLTDLLDNGPKNEIFLQKDQSLVFKVMTNREVQIGLKALDQATTYTINNGESKSISTSTDMFYTVLNKGTSGEQTITITNTGNGILSITKLKICDDPNATLAELTEDDLVDALVSLGFEKDPTGPVDPTDPVTPTDPEPTEPEPTEPEEPEVTYADAALMVSLVDYSGKQIASAELTANGVEGETKAFTAEEVLAAAKANVPEGYVLVDESKVTGTEVAYGENGTVSVQIGKVATLKITYVNLFGRKVGSATITKVQTADGKCTFSASDIKNAAPSGRLALRLTSVSVSYGSEKSITVTVF